MVAIIPARYHSTRLPAKALADIAGRPMIEHVYRRASEARTVDAVLVATDDERIAAAVQAFGGTAY
ncbi:MAG: NTP transferase domain-containing protein [Vicinamibacterales bacterium]